MILSPSRIATLKFCPRKWAWRYVKSKAKPGTLKHYMVFGSMHHATAAAIDLRQPVSDDAARALGLTPRPTNHYGIDTACNEIRIDPTYHITQSPLVDHIRGEVLKWAVPGYYKWVKQHASDWDVVSVEQEHIMKLWDFSLKTIPDAVIRDEQGLWVVERKTTERDDSTWAQKWALNFQTTAECLTVEDTLNEEVQGVILQQVIVTRKRSKTHISGLIPQAIHDVRLMPPRHIAKGPFVKAEGKLYAKAAYNEINWRKTQNHQWDPNYNSCGICELADICTGRVSEDTLVDIPPRG